jgi:hypothetical protein
MWQPILTRKRKIHSVALIDLNSRTRRSYNTRVKTPPHSCLTI